MSPTCLYNASKGCAFAYAGHALFAFAAFAPDAGFALGGHRFPGAASRRSAFGVDAGFPMGERWP